MDPGFLEYVAEYNVLLCSRCRRRVTAGNKVSVHLRNVHRLKGDELKAMVEYGRSLPPASSELLLPPHGSRPRPELPIQYVFGCCICNNDPAPIQYVFGCCICNNDPAPYILYGGPGLGLLACNIQQ